MERSDHERRHRRSWHQISEVLEHIALPTLILMRNGELVHCNAMARQILSEGDGLISFRSHLRALDPQANSALKQAFVHLFTPHTSARFQIVRVRRRSGRRALSLCLIRGNASRESKASAAVFVIDPTRKVELNLGLLSAMHGFSPAEARVVAALIRFGDRQQVATALSLSVHTVRAHIKSMMAKSGERRQIGLVRLLLTGAGALAFRCRELEIPQKGDVSRIGVSLSSPRSNL